MAFIPSEVPSDSWVELYGVPDAKCMLATNQDFVCTDTPETGGKVFCLPRGTEVLENLGPWDNPSTGAAGYKSNSVAMGAEFEPDYCSDP
jgi:hypothetical protein